MSSRTSHILFKLALSAFPNLVHIKLKRGYLLFLLLFYDRIFIFLLFIVLTRASLSFTLKTRALLFTSLSICLSYTTFTSLLICRLLYVQRLLLLCRLLYTLLVNQALRADQVIVFLSLEVLVSRPDDLYCLDDFHRDHWDDILTSSGAGYTLWRGGGP